MIILLVNSLFVFIPGLIDRITSELTHCVINGDPEHRYPGCVNISFAFVEGESLLMACKDIALSSGSACTSASLGKLILYVYKYAS